MSLVSCVLRNLTVLALIDRTLAGSEVRSSLLIPINDFQTEPAPMIAVFTDQAKAEEGDITGADILGAMSTIALTLEIACITKVVLHDKQGEETEIPETDEGMEMTLDFIQRQAIAELQAGSSVWASLWRDCRVRVRGIVVERGASIDKGVRFAARRVEIKLQALTEPVPGKPLTEFWVNVLAAFDADTRTSGLAVLMRKLVQGETLPDWRQWQAELGINDAGIRAIGVAPFEGAEHETTGATPAATKIDIEDHSGQDEVITIGVNSATLTRGDGAPVDLVEFDNG